MPLVFASGAGQEGRHSVGTAVAGGMFFATFLNILFIPVLYVPVHTLRGRRTAGIRATRWLGMRRSVVDVALAAGGARPPHSG